ncbi:MAG: hypothetical protein ACE5FA_04920, partial [Dehalococcoidia bacterium]
MPSLSFDLTSGDTISIDDIMSIFESAGLNITGPQNALTGAPAGQQANDFFGTPFGSADFYLNSIGTILPSVVSLINNAGDNATSAFNASQNAGASLAAAGLSANVSLETTQAQIQAQLIELDKTIKKDIDLANAGFQLQADTFNSNLVQRAKLANAAKSVEIAKLAGSGQARDNIARLLSIGSGAATPGAFSAFSGLPSPFINPNEGQITAPFITAPEATQFDFSFTPFDTSFTPAPPPPPANVDIGAIIADIIGGLGLGFGGAGAGGTGGGFSPSVIAPGFQNLIGGSISAPIGGQPVFPFNPAGTGVPGTPIDPNRPFLGTFERGGSTQRPTVGIVGDSSDGKENRELVFAPGGMTVIPLDDGVDLQVPHFQDGTEDSLNTINLFGQDFEFDPDISDIDLLKGPLAPILNLPTVKEFGAGFNFPLQAPKPTGNFNQQLLQFNPTGARFAGLPNLFTGANRFAGLQGG